MKLLKAFVRTRKVDDVIRALEEARAPGITVSRDGVVFVTPDLDEQEFDGPLRSPRGSG